MLRAALDGALSLFCPSTDSIDRYGSRGSVEDDASSLAGDLDVVIGDTEASMSRTLDRSAGRVVFCIGAPETEKEEEHGGASGSAGRYESGAPV